VAVAVVAPCPTMPLLGAMPSSDLYGPTDTFLLTFMLQVMKLKGYNIWSYNCVHIKQVAYLSVPLFVCLFIFNFY